MTLVSPAGMSAKASRMLALPKGSPRTSPSFGGQDADATAVSNHRSLMGTLGARVFQLKVRFAQLEAAFAQRIFQRSTLGIELDVKTPHLEEIGDAKKDFELVERFEEKIGRTGGKRPTFGLLIGIGGKDDDGEKNFIAGGTKGMKDRKAIHVRHHQIEQDKVGGKAIANFERGAGIGDGADLFVTGF